MEDNLKDSYVDIELRFFILVPYDPNDPELYFQITTDDEDEEEEGSKVSTYNDIPRRHRQIIIGSNVYPKNLELEHYRITSAVERNLNSAFPLTTVNNITSADNVEKTTIQDAYEQSTLSPTYKDFQLIGDSQLLRFSEQILSYKKYIRRRNLDVGSRRLGYCVSGQVIADLKERMLKMEYGISKKVLLLIGTNDFLRNTPLHSMCDTYNSIVELLKNECSHIILLTIPPIPLLANYTKYWIQLKQFNDFVSSFAKGAYTVFNFFFLKSKFLEPTISVIDLASVYISYNNTVSLQYFEKTYCNSMNKRDLIHLNKMGFLLLKSILDMNIA
ncbi:hypothetical protein FQA39_LY10408 [Lamprigera yunnana]|nr:hypothetical protein FQA39_LY10408 [Lamprigera yunnana]